MKKNSFFVWLFFVFFAFSALGCQLVFEPESTAVTRLLSSFPMGEFRYVRQMCDGEDVCAKLGRLGGVIASDWYNARKGFFEITQVEQVEESGQSYVYVNLRLPASGSQPETMLRLVFEMERVKLRWRIYAIDGIDEFLRRATHARGIS
ncbi:MAG: hypothetical protein FWC40_03975 [Proteobacteria bacterium]|nr:hypothetical protein [Pseudomonadota bacterium]